MPRYSITLRCTADDHKKASAYAWATDLDQAKGIARRRLAVAREVFHDGRAWDRWTIAVKLSPHRPPEIVATGGIED